MLNLPRLCAAASVLTHLAQGCIGFGGMQNFHVKTDDGFNWRDLALAVLFFAVLFRAAIPAGFMPQVSGADGSFQIVICTIDGARTIDGTPREGKPLDGALAQSHEPCAFAAGPASPPPSAPIVSVEQAIALVLLPVEAVPLQPSRVAALSHGPRGPPVSPA